MFEEKKRAKELLLALDRCPSSARAGMDVLQCEEAVRELQARLESGLIHTLLCEGGLLGEALVLLRSSSACTLPVPVRLRLLGVIVERVDPGRAMPFARAVERLAVIERDARFTRLFSQLKAKLSNGSASQVFG